MSGLSHETTMLMCNSSQAESLRQAGAEASTARAVQGSGTNVSTVNPNAPGATNNFAQGKTMYTKPIFFPFFIPGYEILPREPRNCEVNPWIHDNTHMATTANTGFGGAPQPPEMRAQEVLGDASFSNNWIDNAPLPNAADASNPPPPASPSLVGSARGGTPAAALPSNSFARNNRSVTPAAVSPAEFDVDLFDSPTPANFRLPTTPGVYNFRDYVNEPNIAVQASFNRMMAFASQSTLGANSNRRIDLSNGVTFDYNFRPVSTDIIGPRRFLLNGYPGYRNYTDLDTLAMIDWDRTCHEW